MIRKRVEWKFRDSSLVLGERTLIVGVLNVTPDSFSDGGSYSEPASAVKRALELQEQGADILDIGAESTRPGSEPVSEAEELRRLIPVLKRLKGKLEIPVSVDTYKPAVAETAIEHGAQIVNDVSGLVWDPDLAKVVLNSGAGLILGHTRGKPEEWARLAPMRDVMGEIAGDLEASIHRARKAGIDLDHIVIDPGIGFGKRKEQNSELLARLGELRRLLLPVMVGPSRKSFLNQEDPKLIEFATAAAVTTAILNGAYLVRVHDVATMRAVAATVDAVIDATPEHDEEKPRKTAKEAVRERDDKEAEKKKPVRPPLIGGPKKVAAAPPAPADDARPPGGEGERPARPPFRGREDDRPARPPRRDDGDRRPPFRSREDGPPSRPPFRGRDDDRPARPPRRDDGDRRPPFRSREDGPPSRPPFRGREGGPPRRDDDRPARPPRRDDGGDRRPPFRGREGGPPRRDEDRPSRPPSRGGAGGPARPPRRDDDRPRPPFRGKPDGPRPPRRDGPGGGPPRGGSKGPGGGKGGPPRGGGRGPSTPRRRD